MFLLDITISINDLILGLLALAGIAVLISLTIFFLRLSQTLKSVNQMALESQPKVDEILTEVTVTLRQTQGILEDVDKITTAAGESVPSMVKSAAEAGESLADTVGALGQGAHSAITSANNFFQRIGKKGAKLDFDLADKKLSLGTNDRASSNLTQVFGAALGTYRFIQKVKKARRAAERKKKFGF